MIPRVEMIRIENCSGYPGTLHCPDEIKTIVESLPAGTTCDLGLRPMEFMWTAEQFAEMKGKVYGRQGSPIVCRTPYPLAAMSLALRIPISKRKIPDGLFDSFEQTMPCVHERVPLSFSVCIKNEYEKISVKWGEFAKPWMNEVLAVIHKYEPDFPPDHFYKLDEDGCRDERLVCIDEVSKRPNEVPISTWKATRKGEIKCSFLLLNCLASDFLKPKNQEVVKNAITILTQ